MINRENWKVVNLYLAYRRDVDLLSVSSQRLEKTWLCNVLEWADDVSFSRASKIRPSFPQYILSFSFSSIYTTHILRSAHRFFVWLVNHQPGYSVLTVSWLDTLKVRGLFLESKEHEYVTYDEICAIARAPVQNIRERRIRASAVFWWLSGIRVGAFVTLPVSAVDLYDLSVRQWPKLGVHTKFKKHATTFLLDIPELVSVVCEWDKEVRTGGSRFWFGFIDPGNQCIDPGVFEVGKHRNIRAGKDLRSWLSRVGLPYHSPHKFRHGHAVYSIKHAEDISTLKAISQNLMHANLSVTDGVYGILSDNDVKSKIQGLGKKRF